MPPSALRLFGRPWRQRSSHISEINTGWIAIISTCDLPQVAQPLLAQVTPHDVHVAVVTR